MGRGVGRALAARDALHAHLDGVIDRREAAAAAAAAGFSAPTAGGGREAQQQRDARTRGGAAAFDRDGRLRLGYPSPTQIRLRYDSDTTQIRLR